MIPRVSLRTRIWLAAYLELVHRLYRVTDRVHAVSDPMCNGFLEATYALSRGRGMECRPCADRRRQAQFLRELDLRPP